ncbi:MAG: zinc dependent phospholipase C family protein [Gemmatimonadaceae bacterium]
MAYRSRPRKRGRAEQWVWCAWLVAIALVVAPGVAHAWTPGTHVFLGEAVMRSLALLPPAVAALLREFSYDFLYGSIAADTSIAKKYAPVGRHCHSWNVGMEIFDGANDERLKAFGLGYLSHLAADSVAHNYFVPKQLAVTSSTSSLGHSYWESRFETHLGAECARRARELILIDHSPADGLLDRVLSPTIFSTSTNRRIFRGMVIVADNESWQRIFQLMTDNSRWDLLDDDVGRYLARSYDFIMDLLIRMDRAEPFTLDPSGDHALRLAKQLRRSVLRESGASRLHEEAERHFGLPTATLPFAKDLGNSLYVPSRAASN